MQETWTEKRIQKNVPRVTPITTDFCIYNNAVC